MASAGGCSSYASSMYRIYFDEFREFMRDELVKEPEYHIQNSREALNTMLEPGFSELVIDLYEEVLRRKAVASGRSETTLPAPRKDYHPTRNETRIKLASARTSKIKSLVNEVYHELGRRFPECLRAYPRLEFVSHSASSDFDLLKDDIAGTDVSDYKGLESMEWVLK